MVIMFLKKLIVHLYIGTFEIRFYLFFTPNHNNMSYKHIILTYISYDIISGIQTLDDCSYTFSILSYFEGSQTKNSSFHSYAKIFRVYYVTFKHRLTQLYIRKKYLFFSRGARIQINKHNRKKR